MKTIGIKAIKKLKIKVNMIEKYLRVVTVSLASRAVYIRQNRIISTASVWDATYQNEN